MRAGGFRSPGYRNGLVHRIAYLRPASKCTTIANRTPRRASTLGALPLRDLQDRLENAADPATRTWFENYTKHAIRYRGVKTPEIARIIAEWRRETGVDKWPPRAGLDLASDLTRQQLCEDKFAGILFLQKYVLKQFGATVLLDAMDDLIADGAIWDWSTNDWLCARVLAPVLRRDGAPAVGRVAEWSGSENMWQRRSSAVALRGVAQQVEFHPHIAEAVARLIPERERFIQTGAGWLIADLSRHAPEFAATLVEQHFEDLSVEVVRRHLKRLPDYEDYKKRKRRAG